MADLFNVFPHLRRAADVRLGLLHREAYISHFLSSEACDAEVARIGGGSEMARSAIERYASGAGVGAERLCLALALRKLTFEERESAREFLASRLKVPHIPGSSYSPMVGLAQIEDFRELRAELHLHLFPKVLQCAAGITECTGEELFDDYVFNEIRNTRPGTGHAPAAYLWAIHLGTERALEILRRLYLDGWIKWQAFSPLYRCLVMGIAASRSPKLTLTFNEFVGSVFQRKAEELRVVTDDDAMLETCDFFHDEIVARIQRASDEAESLGAWWRQNLVLEAECETWRRTIAQWTRDATSDATRSDLARYDTSFEEWRVAVTVDRFDFVEADIFSQGLLARGLVSKASTFPHRARFPRKLLDEVAALLPGVPASARPTVAAKMYVGWVAAAPRELQSGFGDSRGTLFANVLKCIGGV